MALAISVRAGSRKATVWPRSIADMVVCSLAPGEAVHETAKNEVAKNEQGGKSRLHRNLLLLIAFLVTLRQVPPQRGRS